MISLKAISSSQIGTAVRRRRGPSRAGFTLVGLLLLITLAGLILGLIVELRNLTSGQHQLIRLSLSADSTKLVGVFGDGHVDVFNTVDQRVATIGRWPARFGMGMVQPIALSNDGELLAFARTPIDSPADAGDSVAIWDIDRVVEQKDVPSPGEFVSDLAFSPDHRLLYCITDGVPQTFNIATGEFVDWPAPGQPGALSSLTVSPDGESLAAVLAGPTMSVVAFDTAGAGKTPTHPLTGFSSAQLSYSPDGRRLSVVEQKGSGRLRASVTTLDATTFAVVSSADFPERALWNAEYTPDGKFLLAMSWPPGEFVTLDAETLELKSTNPTPAGFPWAMSARAGVFASANDNVVTIWDLRDGRPTGVRWKYAPGPWRVMLISAGVVLWFLAYGVLRRRHPKPGSAICRVCGRGLRRQDRTKRTCPTCAATFLTVAQARRRLWRVLAIAFVMIVLAAAAMTGGDEVWRKIGLILLVGAGVILGLILLVYIRHYVARIRYRRQLAGTELATAAESPGARWSVTPEGHTMQTSGGATSIDAAMLAQCVARVRDNFRKVTGRPAQFPAGLTVTVYENAADFSRDLAVYRVDGRRNPCLYAGFAQPRVVICPPAVRNNLSSPKDSLTAALAWSLLGGAEAKHIPTAIGSGLALRITWYGDERESQRINQLVLALLNERDALGPEMLKVTAARLWARMRQINNHDENLYCALFRLQAASLVDYLTTAAPPAQREGFRGYVAQLLDRRTKRSLADALGAPLEAVFAQWQQWLRSSTTAGNPEPTAEQSQVVLEKLAPLVRDRASPFTDRMTAIRNLGEHRFLVGADALVELLATPDDDPDLQRAALTALRLISGKRFGPVAEVWRKWWDETVSQTPFLAEAQRAGTLEP